MTVVDEPASGGDTYGAPAEGRDTSRLVSRRGQTTLAPVVFERIAARAASEIDGVETVVRTGLSRLLPTTSPPGADAELEARTVCVDLTVNLVYPLPVRQTTERVRDHVMERLEGLTGFDAAEINITVADLISAPRRRRVE